MNYQQELRPELFTRAIRVTACILGVLLLAGTYVTGASNKFAAFVHTKGLLGEEIPGQTPGTSTYFDVRQARQPAFFQGVGPSAYCAPWESRDWADHPDHKGFLHIACDEPDVVGVSVENYFNYYRFFVAVVSAVDPTARFSPAGTVFESGFHQQFYDLWLSLPPAERPRIDEWRFHVPVSCGTQYCYGAPTEEQLQTYKTAVVDAAQWCAATGRPMVLVPQLWHWRTEWQIDALHVMLTQAEEIPNIVYVTWWSHSWPDPEGGSSHKLADATGAHTPFGVKYLEFVTKNPSTAWSGASAMADYTGPDADGKRRADFANLRLSSGEFTVFKNEGYGTVPPAVAQFATTPWTSAYTIQSIYPAWRSLAADFLGSAYADLGQIGPEGDLYQILNQSGTFTYQGNWGRTRAPGFPATFQILTGDFNGDGIDDVLEHDLKTGRLWVRLRNPSVNGEGAYEYIAAPDRVLPLQPAPDVAGRAMVGPEWRLLVADFTGDGRADFADQHVPSGTFWIHRNLGTADHYRFSAANWSWWTAGAGPYWTTLVGDFNGDGHADYADWNRESGYFWVHAATGSGTFYLNNWGEGRSAYGADWTILGQGQ